MATKRASKRNGNQLPPTALTDAEWLTLCTLREFDPIALETGEARKRIDASVNEYCTSVAAGIHKLRAKDINKSIEESYKALIMAEPHLKYLRNVQRLTKHTGAFVHVYWPNDTTFWYDLKDEHFEQLKKITKLLGKCRNALPRVKRGSKNNLLVDHFIFTVQFALLVMSPKGRILSRTPNQRKMKGKKEPNYNDVNFFVTLFEQLKSRTQRIVTKSMIESAMKRIIKDFRDHPERANVIRDLGIAKSLGPEAVKNFFAR